MDVSEADKIFADEAIRKAITAAMVCKVLTRCATTTETPEGKLWLSVLLTAVKESTMKAHKAECARFFSSTWFEQVCDFCGLDPEFTREAISLIGKRHNVPANRLAEGESSPKSGRG